MGRHEAPRGLRHLGHPHDGAVLRWLGLRGTGRARAGAGGHRLREGGADGRWLGKDGKGQEKVYDVVWGDASRRKIGPKGKLTPVGDTVDVKAATWTNTIGAPELSAVWTDPDFDPSLRAFYYARVIEIPTLRWTCSDAVRFGIKMSPEVPMKQQERAWASPIWYTPAK